MHSPRSVILIAGLSVAALAACSGSSSSDTSPAETTPAASPTASPTQTAALPTTSPTDSLCTEEAILAAIPEGSEMVKYNCADVSGTQWAAVEVNPGPTVFFLQASGDTWDVSTSDEVCGTASAGLPPELLDYCSDVESSS
ncbi:MAG: hypothetical protein KDC08_05345 [Actinobacteria bacterium]|nr:hypothetical protein [Actinomycetota bacterium]